MEKYYLLLVNGLFFLKKIVTFILKEAFSCLNSSVEATSSRKALIDLGTF